MSKRISSKNVYNLNSNRYTQQQTPSTSPDDASTSTSKFTIEKQLPTNKKGTNNVKRILDPNKEIVIPRRIVFQNAIDGKVLPGEGIKPIFNREDVQVNSYLKSNSSTRRSLSISPTKRCERRRSSTSSCSSESPQRYRPVSKTENTNSPQRYRPKSRRHEKSLTPKRKKTPEKVPYFVDTKREQDRLKSRVEVSRNKSDNKHSTSTESRRRKTKSRSRSYERKRRRSSSRDKYRTRSYSRHRYPSRHIRSRSHSRDRYYRSSRMPVETQYIPVPVPMEYSPFNPRWLQPMLPYPYPRYPMMRAPTNFPMPPFFPPRMQGQAHRFQRPHREKHHSRHQ